MGSLSFASAQTNYQRIKSFGPLVTGGNPFSKLIEASDGWLYGTTHSGGLSSQGTVFKLRTDGTGYAILINFTNGLFPIGGLIEGTNGILYGTTSGGGAGNHGLVFEIDKQGGGFAVLHELGSSVSDGALPSGDLVFGLDGRLYGTASQGGSSNLGTVFRLNADGSGYTNLHHFAGLAGSADGANPYAGLTQVGDGTLYGTTQNGGSNNFGTIFKLDPSGSGYAVLQHFRGAAFGDGRQPLGALTQGTNGSLYGTTYYGGSRDLGTIYKLNTNGTGYSILLSFTNSLSGYQPWGGLAQGTNGYLYATTRLGGTNDLGTVFRVNQDGSGYTKLHDFSSTGGDGTLPQAPLLLLASDGSLYGVTPTGGDSALGTIFRLFSSAPQVIITSISKVGGSTLLNFAGAAAGQTYNVEMAPDVFGSGGWLGIGSRVANIDGTFQFLDASTTNCPMRFYRSAAQ